ncbi:MAG: response regulator [Bacteroidetes bacterium]|nr:response regulator [Bacteroidota bacterium]
MKQVLAIDKDIPTLNTINYYAHELGLEVFSSPGELNAWEVKMLNPDIVLIDCHLNCLNGNDLCLQLKSDPQTQGITIIILSGAQDYHRALKKIHADAYLLKPLNKSGIVQTLQRFIN